MLLVSLALFNNSSERARGRGRRKTELREGESATGCDQVGPPVYDFCITGTRCQTFSPWKECLPNQFHVNGLGGNHSPLVRLRVQLLKHAPREKYREDGGQEEENKRIEKVRWGLACFTRVRISSGHRVQDRSHPSKFTDVSQKHRQRICQDHMISAFQQEIKEGYPRARTVKRNAIKFAGPLQMKSSDKSI